MINDLLSYTSNTVCFVTVPLMIRIKYTESIESCVGNAKEVHITKLVIKRTQYNHYTYRDTLKVIQVAKTIFKPMFS